MRQKRGASGEATPEDETAPLSERSLAATLERIAAPAFVARDDGSWDYANARGRESSARAASVIARAIADFEARRQTTAEVVRVRGEEHPTRWLVILHDEPGDTIAAAGASWDLTARQLAVLRLIAGGEANKTIAGRLGCSEATVEAHATAIYKKARVDSRSALIAKLLAIRS